MSDCDTTMSAVFSTLPIIDSGGRILFDPCWAEQTHADQRCELLLVIRGNVELELGGSRYPAGPGDLLFVPSRAAHRDLFDLDEGLDTFMVFFSWEAEADFFSLFANDMLRTISPVRKADLVRQCEQLRQEMRHDDSEDQLVARARLLTLLLTVRRVAIGHAAPSVRPDESRTRRRQSLMLQARRYLNEHFTEPVSLDDIARTLGVSAYYLSHIFSEENDFSLFSYLTALRMERARELLQAGRSNVSEVARAVGYENGNYFAKVFRKHFGRPPGEYL